MNDLVDFLRVRIAEDEENANACQNWSECGPSDWENQEDPTYGCPGHPSTRRRLAECESRRRIVAEYVTVVIEGDAVDRVALGGYKGGLGFALRALAVSYAAHPDYREEWRP